jgi:hypothetical protein
MAAGPWRCSQCGTINEPVANSCRTCGKWPSLFDLQDNIVDEAELFEVEGVEAPIATLDPEPMEVPVFEPPPQAVPVPAHLEPEPETPTIGEDDVERPRRRWTSAIIPVAVLVYFVISAILDRGGG